MDVDLTRLPADPGGWRVATAADRDEIDAWVDQALGMVARRAAARGRPGQTRDQPRTTDGIAAVCAYDVNRAGWSARSRSAPT